MNSSKILLIEKDKSAAIKLTALFKASGFDLFAAHNIKEAAGLCALHNPDIVILDVNKESSEFIKALKKEPYLYNLPLLLLSDGNQESEILDCLSISQCDYSVKPISLEDIMLRVNIALKRKRDMPREKALSGKLSELSLVGLIQIMEMENKAGNLKLSDGSKSGSIFFEKGKITRAELNNLEGEAAIYTFLTWRDGNFVLEPNESGVIKNVSLNNQEILMEGMRRIDEWERLKKERSRIILIGAEGSGNTELINTLTGGSVILSKAQLTSDSYPLEFGRVRLKDTELLLYSVSIEEGASVEDEVYTLLQSISREMLGYVLFIDSRKPMLLGFARYLLSSFTSHYDVPFVVALIKSNNTLQDDAESLSTDKVRQGLRLNKRVPIIFGDPKSKGDAALVLNNLLDLAMGLEV
ncbi:MAG: DUF4388 domain-containing protein [Nitrospirae bacterium]|nr:DUF4388 domain-containing protein [Nitrospirota bacterium]